MAANLDALDLELSQSHKFHELINQKEGYHPAAVAEAPRREVGGSMMESLDLQTGYKGVLEKREERLASLAQKYNQDMIDFEDEERKVNAEVA